MSTAPKTSIQDEYRYLKALSELQNENRGIEIDASMIVAKAFPYDGYDRKDAAILRRKKIATFTSDGMVGRVYQLWRERNPDPGYVFGPVYERRKNGCFKKFNGFLRAITLEQADRVHYWADEQRQAFSRRADYIEVGLLRSGYVELVNGRDGDDPPVSPKKLLGQRKKVCPACGDDFYTSGFRLDKEGSEKKIFCSSKCRRTEL